jgi:hypothetical protein
MEEGGVEEEEKAKVPLLREEEETNEVVDVKEYEILLGRRGSHIPFLLPLSINRVVLIAMLLMQEDRNQKKKENRTERFLSGNLVKVNKEFLAV